MDKKLTSETPSFHRAGTQKKTFRAPVKWDADSLSRDLYYGAILLTALTNKKPDAEMFEALYDLRVKTLDFAKKKFVKK